MIEKLMTDFTFALEQLLTFKNIKYHIHFYKSNFKPYRENNFCGSLIDNIKINLFVFLMKNTESVNRI